MELLRDRRSIRNYTDKCIEPEKIEILKEAVLRSFAAKNPHLRWFVMIR